MKLIKESAKITISNNIYSASSLIDATFGLIFKKDLDLFFKTRFGIHTFFMKKKIDILILDSDFKVIRIKEKMRPNRIFIWNPIFFNVIELESGTISKFGIQVGDKLILD